MRDFTVASGLYSEAAKALREKLVALDLVEVNQERRGGAEIHEIRLTGLGREVGKLCVAIDEALSRAKAKREARR